MRRDARELALQRALKSALFNCRGARSEEAQSSLLRARELCERLGDRAQMYYVYQELWDFYAQRGEFVTARESAQRALDVAKSRRDPDMIASAQLRLGLNSFWTEPFAEATTNFDQMQHDGLTYGLRAGSRYMPSRTVRALNDGFLGYLDRCREPLSETVLRVRGKPDIHFVALALTHHALGHLLAGEEFVARSSAEEAIALSKEHRFEERAAIGKCIRGIALTDQAARRWR